MCGGGAPSVPAPVVVQPKDPPKMVDQSVRTARGKMQDTVRAAYGGRNQTLIADPSKLGQDAQLDKKVLLGG